ncbi:MAG: alpha/beta hydrolase [Solirubrobacterales bacterium]|nr:alpha/beta hydrolase [Solirubrobacterales bacterium]
MAKLPRFSSPVEHRIVKAVCGLPPGVQRRLFGKPPTIDGQTLASEVQTLIRLAELVGSESFSVGMAASEARDHTRIEAEIACRRPPIPMARVAPIEIPGPVRSIPARLYVPGAPPGGDPTALLVYYHGGGWVVGDLETHDGVCRFLAATAGVSVLAIDYRLAPENPFPAAVEDAVASFQWAAGNAASLGADPARIAVGGDSAGGNLAAVVSVLARDAGGPRPAMQLLIYPVTDAAKDRRSRQLFAEGFLLTQQDSDFFEASYLPPGTDPTDPRVSVLRTAELGGLPSAYVATAGFDPLRDEGEAYALAMREAGVRVALRRHPGLVHSFANQTAIGRTARGAMLEAAGALRMGLAA